MSSREGEGEDSVKFTVEVDVTDATGTGGTPKDIEKLIDKKVKEAVARENRKTPKPKADPRIAHGVREANRLEAQRRMDADHISRMIAEHNREVDKNNRGVVREYEQNLKEKIKKEKEFAKWLKERGGVRSKAMPDTRGVAPRGRRGMASATENLDEVEELNALPHYEREHILDMHKVRPDSDADRMKADWWGGGKARSQGSPTLGDDLAKRRRLMELAQEADRAKIRTQAATQMQKVKKGIGARQQRIQSGLSATGSRISAGQQRAHIQRQKAAARAAVKAQKLAAKQEKAMERSLRAFFAARDKQQQADLKAWQAQQIANQPRGFFDRFTGAQNRFESMTKKVRTKAQRLNTYGLFFLETAQVNPIYTAGKFILNTISGMGPHGKAVAFAIAAIASSVMVAQATIKNFSQKGLPLNQDWHRSMKNETSGLLTLDEQFRYDKGLLGYTVPADVGYNPIDETSVYNSYLSRDEIRIHKLTQEEKVRIYV